MSNIQLFRLTTAEVLGKLYESFPLPKELSPYQIVTEIDRGEYSEENARLIIGHTLMWLTDSGFVMRRGEVAPFRYTLTSKGFEILNHEAIESRDRTLGEELGGALKKIGVDAVNDAAREGAKGVIQSGVSKILILGASFLSS